MTGRTDRVTENPLLLLSGQNARDDGILVNLGVLKSLEDRARGKSKGQRKPHSRQPVSERR